MANQVIPESVRYAVGKMDFNSNCFRLLPNGAVTAGPNSRVLFTLPGNATIDLRSLVFSFDVTTTSDNTNGGGAVVYAKLPANSSSLIAQISVMASGVLISQSFSEYNTACKIKHIIHSSRDRDGSIDGTLHHGVISTTDAVDDVSVLFKPTLGLFGESSTRFLNTALCGDISVELVFAPTSVLAYKEHGRALDQNFSDANAKANALNVTYSVSNLSASVHTVSFGETYDQLLLSRLVDENSLMVRYKEYYSFSLKGTQSTAHDLRFSLSASSVDALYLAMRDANYENSGIRTRQYSGAVQSDANCANAFKFLAFNDSTTKRGSMRYNFEINSVKYGQFAADVLDACHEHQMLSDQHGYGARGTMISSLADFNDGKAVFPLVLNFPGQPISVQSGVNTRGSNSQFSVSVTGQTIPAANADAQTTASLSSYLLVETTATLHIQGAKSVVPVY